MGGYAAGRHEGLEDLIDNGKVVAQFDLNAIGQSNHGALRRTYRG